MSNVVARLLVKTFAAAGAHQLDAGRTVTHADEDGLVGRGLRNVVGAVVLESVAVSPVDGLGGEVCVRVGSSQHMRRGRERERCQNNEEDIPWPSDWSM